LWELESGREIRRWDGRGGQITSLALSADGRTALIVNRAGSLTVWDVGNWKVIKQIRVPQGTLSTRFSPDERRCLLAGGRHQSSILQLLDLDTGEDLGSFEGHDGNLWEAIFSPDGSRVLSTGFDCTIRLWDAKTRVEVRRFRGEVPAECLAFFANGRFVLAGNHPKGAMLRWLDVDSGADVQLLTGHSDMGHNCWVRCIAISRDGRRALSGAFDRTVRMWNLASADAD
jgi:WD40 repeat protein